MEFKLTLDHVARSDIAHTFRLAFSDCDTRMLLPYPSESGLQFFDTTGNNIAEMKTDRLASSPLDDFVLSTNSRIAFDLHAHFVAGSDNNPQWTVELPNGAMYVQFHYHVDDKRDWYDFLAKRSRFADQTPPWNGRAESNTIKINH